MRGNGAEAGVRLGANKLSTASLLDERLQPSEDHPSKDAVLAWEDDPIAAQMILSFQQVNGRNEMGGRK